MRYSSGRVAKRVGRGRRKSLDAAVGGELSGKYGLGGIDLQFKRLIAHSGEVKRSRGQKELFQPRSRLTNPPLPPPGVRDVYVESRGGETESDERSQTNYLSY